ncbi:site-specific DNA-methyltransferase [Weissella cibaria]|nr:site-specific DNA-methyltransferase [Weissella cibaria]
MEALRSVLSSTDEFKQKYWRGEALKRNKVVEDLRDYDASLIEALLKNELIANSYTMEVAGNTVLKLGKLSDALQYKEYWEDSYTKFANKIGLSADGKFIDESSDVVLQFPFADTVLKAGMSREDGEKDELRPNEPFLNETISQTEISTLFAPKIFKNTEHFGERDETLNLVIKGNNLIALHSLVPNFSGKVKLIYLDPPYNTGSDSFNYNDRFNHATWLTFMKNRLEVAKKLLSIDGMIFVHTDDSEQAYLKVLMDDIFGRDSYLNTVIVKTKASSGASGGGEDKRLKKNVEYLTIYKNELADIQIQEKSVPLDEYISTRKEEGKGFAYTQVLVNPGTLTKVGETRDGRGDTIELYDVSNFEIKSVKEVAKTENMSEIDVYNKYLDKIFTTENAQTSIRDRVKNAVPDDGYTIARYVPVSGKNKGKITDVGFIGSTKRLVSFLSATAYIEDGVAYKTEKAGTLWDDLSWSSIKSEGGVEFNNGEKPEKLLQRVIASATEEGDLVMDFFMGSGTTQAVAMKMGRQFIGIEQMDYIKTVSVERLKKVIEGEQSGISKDVNWQGGGSFVYAELMEKNQGYIGDIAKAGTPTELAAVYERMKDVADFDFRADLDKFIEQKSELTFDERKQMLVKILDKNQLYYNYADIDDVDVRDLISDEDYNFNKTFYEGGEA